MVRNTVYTKDPLHELLKFVLDEYKKASMYAFEKKTILSVEETEKEPFPTDEYNSFNTNLYNFLTNQDNIRVNVPVYSTEKVDHFIGLKLKIIEFLVKLIENNPIHKTDIKSMLFSITNTTERNFHDSIDKKNEKGNTFLGKNDNNLIYYILDSIDEKVKKSSNSNTQSGGKRKTKVYLKENGKEYLVHVNEKKEKFIKKRGEVVFLKSIRGKYNNVK